MIFRLKKLSAVVIAFAALALTLAAQTPAAGPTLQEATALFQAQKWDEAVKAFSAITVAEPKNVQAWAFLGWSSLPLNKNAQAAAAFQKALELAQRPRLMYGLASAYARMNEKDKAFEWLTKALNANLPQARQIRNDPNLENLRPDPRFKEVSALAEKLSNVCMNSPAYRQFDFWVGEWSVQIRDQEVGTNNVKLLQDGCIIEENWAARGGQTGKSLNFYNSVTHQWHQTYMDNDAGIWMMDGEYKDGAMRLVGSIFSLNGQVMTRSTFFNLGPDKVRQLGETSMDGGKNWTVVWDAIYVRKK